MRSLLTAHLKEKGRALVNDPERQKEPVEFVTRLLEEKDKYDSLVREAFSGDKGFANAANAAFEHFINLNSRSPEYISLFVDDKLRKGLKARAAAAAALHRRRGVSPTRAATASASRGGRA